MAEVEEEEEEEGQVTVLPGYPRCQKTQTVAEGEMLAWSCHPPGGSNPPSHWPVRRCPSHTSPRPTGWEGCAGADGMVTELAGCHGEDRGDGGGGFALCQKHCGAMRGHRSKELD